MSHSNQEGSPTPSMGETAWDSNPLNRGCWYRKVIRADETTAQVGRLDLKNREHLFDAGGPDGTTLKPSISVAAQSPSVGASWSSKPRHDGDRASPAPPEASSTVGGSGRCPGRSARCRLNDQRTRHQIRHPPNHSHRVAETDCRTVIPGATPDQSGTSGTLGSERDDEADTNVIRFRGVGGR